MSPSVKCEQPRHNKAQNSQHFKLEHSCKLYPQKAHHLDNHIRYNQQDKYAGLNFLQKDQALKSLLKSHKHNEACQLLETLVDEIEQTNNSSEEQYNQNLSKASKIKDYLLYICYYNLGAVFSKTKKNSLTLRYIQQASIHLNAVQKACKQTQEKLYFRVEKVRMMLKKCALVSLLGNHQAAENHASDAIIQLLAIFKDYLQFIDHLYASLLKSRQKPASYVDFRRIILKQARDKLTILALLDTPSKIARQSASKLNQKAQNISRYRNKLYKWKINLDNNQRYIRETLDMHTSITNETRNILGIAKVSSWIQQLNIGQMMSVYPKKITQDEFFNLQTQHIDPYCALSEDKILQLYVLSSAAYFSVATEKKMQYISKLPKQVHENIKFLEMQNNKQFNNCKILHLKSIQLACRFLPQSNGYISHLISSFNKNYKFYMQNICEQSHNCQSSLLQNEYSTKLEVQNDVRQISSDVSRNFSQNITKNIQYKRKRSANSQNKPKQNTVTRRSRLKSQSKD